MKAEYISSTSFSVTGDQTDTFVVLRRVLFNFSGEDAANVKLKYRSPSNQIGEWDTTIEDIGTGIVYYDTPLGQPLTAIGAWTAWPIITLNSGKIIPGTPFTFETIQEGT